MATTMMFFESTGSTATIGSPAPRIELPSRRYSSDLYVGSGGAPPRPRCASVAALTRHNAATIITATSDFFMLMSNLLKTVGWPVESDAPGPHAAASRVESLRDALHRR